MIEILFEQGPCLVVNKPGGLLTQAPPGVDSLETRVKNFLRQREGKTGNIYLGVPHRLDRPVSGAIVFARHARAARRLAEQFEGRTTRKTYVALLEGALADPRGAWRDHLRKVPDEPRAELAPEGHPEARLAVLRYRLLARLDNACCVAIELETGRMHQIRLQAAARGHPVLGDALYGAAAPFGPTRDDPRERSIALHARRLGLRHPMTDEPLEAVAPWPDHWPTEARHDGVASPASDGRDA